jgi:hypothetical protein
VFKVVSQKSFVKGTVAVSNRFSVPKGAVMRAINMLLTERGALQTCDGTKIVSGVPQSGITTLVELGTYNNLTSAPILLVIAITSATTFSLYNFGTNPATLITTGTITSGWQNPQLFAFAGFTIVTVGNGQTPYTFNGTTLTTLSTNSSWQANTLYQVGDRIVAAGNTFVVASLSESYTNSGTGTGVSSTAPTSYAGLSGSSMPAFGGVTPVGATIADNQIHWQFVSGNPAFGHQTVPGGAAHGIVFAQALWLWNTGPSNSGLDGPNVIRQSTVNNPNSWPDANLAYVGKDDGDSGTGMASFTIAEAGISPTGSLVLFKNYSSYQVTGVFGASNFAIQLVKTDMGCIAGRTPLFATGFGIIRFAHLGFALFDGVNDTLISEEIRPYIFGDAVITGVDFTNAANGRGALVTSPPMYCCALPLVGQSGKLTRVFCYDLTMKAWMVVDVTGTQAYRAFKQIRLPNQPTTTYFADALSDGTSFNVRRWQVGDPDFDGTAIPYSIQPPEVGDPGSRAFFRRVMVRGHALTAGKMTMGASLGAAALPNDTEATAPTGPNSSAITPVNSVRQANYVGDQDLAVSFDIGETAASGRASFSGTGRVTIEGFDWHVALKKPRPVGQGI